MGMNFPNTPLLGATFSPGTGLPTYKWDGEKWIATATYTDGSVRYDAVQSLTTAQQTQARSNIYAAPFDAMAYSGMQINGGMEVSQEKGTTGTISSGFICDGWKVYTNGSMVTTTYGANTSTPCPGLPCCAAITVQTAQSSLGANDSVQFYQYVEGYRIARLAWGVASAQPITVAFWSCHHRPGLYSISIRSGALTRSYAAGYTQAAADVWQYNVIAIPGDTTGTWATDNSTGILVTFMMAAGSGLVASSANTWLASGVAIAVSGQVNGVAATSDVFRITGVVILPGTQAPTAAQSPLIMRPYDQELMLCQRYYEKSYDVNAAIGTNTNNGALFYAGAALLAGVAMPFYAAFKARKRAAPTVTTYSVATGAAGKVRDIANAIDLSSSISTAGETSTSFYGVTTASTYQGTAHWTADARL